VAASPAIGRRVSRRPELGLRALRGPPAGPADIVEAEAVPHVRLAATQALGPRREVDSLPAARCCTGRYPHGTLQVADHRNRGDRAGGGAPDRGPADQRARGGGSRRRRSTSACGSRRSGRPVGHPEPISPPAKSSGQIDLALRRPRRGARGRPGQPGRGGPRTRAWAVHTVMGAGRRPSRAVGRREGGIPVDGQARASRATSCSSRGSMICRPMRRRTDRAISALVSSRWSRSP
jgi:hypothetical protein